MMNEEIYVDCFYRKRTDIDEKESILEVRISGVPFSDKNHVEYFRDSVEFCFIQNEFVGEMVDFRCWSIWEVGILCSCITMTGAEIMICPYLRVFESNKSFDDGRIRTMERNVNVYDWRNAKEANKSDNPLRVYRDFATIAKEAQGKLFDLKVSGQPPIRAVRFAEEDHEAFLKECEADKLF